MNPVPSSIGAAALPQASLIPPEFAQRRQSARKRMIGLLILVVACGVVVAGWFLAAGVNLAAENRLADEQERRSQLSAELASYSYVRAAQDVHDNAVNAQTWAGATDIRWDDYLVAIAQALPAGVTFENFQVSQASPVSGLGLDSGTPFAQNDLGEISFTGIATSPQAASDAVDALRAISGLSEVEFGGVRMSPDADSGTVLWEFEFGARISNEALSGRTILSEAGPIVVDDESGDDEEEASDEE